jgi:hypothetical protein
LSHAELSTAALSARIATTALPRFLLRIGALACGLLSFVPDVLVNLVHSSAQVLALQVFVDAHDGNCVREPAVSNLSDLGFVAVQFDQQEELAVRGRERRS